MPVSTSQLRRLFRRYIFDQRRRLRTSVSLPSSFVMFASDAELIWAALTSPSPVNPIQRLSDRVSYEVQLYMLTFDCAPPALHSMEFFVRLRNGTVSRTCTCNLPVALSSLCPWYRAKCEFVVRNNGVDFLYGCF